jgi:hypothetical protein
VHFLQAYIHLLGESRSIGALQGALVQLKTAAARTAADAPGMPPASAAPLQRVAALAWSTYMQQVTFRQACVTAGYSKLRSFCRSSAPLGHPPGAAYRVLAERMAGGPGGAADALAALLQRGALAQALQSGLALGALAAKQLSATLTGARSLHDEPWRGVAGAGDAGRLSEAQATLLAILAQCAPAGQALCCRSSSPMIAGVFVCFNIVCQLKAQFAHQCRRSDEELTVVQVTWRARQLRAAQ